MRARDAVGRKIVALEQRRTMTTGGPVWELEAIVLDNGTRLYAMAHEHPSGDGYPVELCVSKAPRCNDCRRGGAWFMIEYPGAPVTVCQRCYHKRAGMEPNR